VSLAVEMLEAGVGFFHISGFDIQRACIETAMSGRIPVAGLPRYVVAHVEPKVMNHLSFYELDVLRDPVPGKFDLVVCRNFLGYFTPDVGRAIVEKLAAALNAPGCLLVDSFILGKHPPLLEGLGLRRVDGLPVFWRD
jgi:chemotaxis methyl-accepting protein methylase